MVFLIALSAHLCEAAIYMRLWHVLYTHNKSMALILGHEEVKRRIRRSAVSLICDMYYYVVETGTIIILGTLSIYGTTTSLHIYLLFWQFTFPIKNSFQAMSTESVRNIYLRSIYKVGQAFGVTEFGCRNRHWQGFAKKAN